MLRRAEQQKTIEFYDFRYQLDGKSFCSFTCSIAEKVCGALGGGSYPVTSIRLTRAEIKLADTDFVHLDIGGEGPVEFPPPISVRSGFPKAINVNANTVNYSTDRVIPNLVRVPSWYTNPTYPFADGFADYITMQNAPLTPTNVDEIARCLRPGGKVCLWIDLSFYEQIELPAKKLLAEPNYHPIDEFDGSVGNPKTEIVSRIGSAQDRVLPATMTTTSSTSDNWAAFQFASESTRSAAQDIKKDEKKGDIKTDGEDKKDKSTFSPNPFE